MRFITTILLGLVCLGMTAPAHANVPDKVMDAYKLYQKAEKSGDSELALRAARAAWQHAETLSGDTKLTGDLAFNYAGQPNAEKLKDQVEAATRSMELVADYGEEANLVYLERGLLHVQLLQARGDNFRAMRVAERLIDFADGNGLSNSTFTAEALTIAAGVHASRDNNEKAAEAAERALSIFENATDGVASAYTIHANLYRGYAFENEDDHMEAALSYQQVMEMTDGLDPAKYNVVGMALGRWIHMRDALRQDDRLEEAEQDGLCQCWPYDKDRTESVQPIERKPPKLPRNFAQSGYVVIEFDLTDEGKTTNPEVITAWPDYYRESALEALEDWEYSPRQDDETDEDRTDLVQTFRFRILDEYGKPIW